MRVPRCSGVFLTRTHVYPAPDLAFRREFGLVVSTPHRVGSGKLGYPEERTAAESSREISESHIAGEPAHGICYTRFVC